MACKNVVFDMGGVLIEDDLDSFCAGYADDPGEREILKGIIQSPEWQEWDRGTMNAQEVSEAVSRRMPEHLRHMPARFVREWHMEPTLIPGMEALIRELKAAGCGLYILSNTAVSYYDYRHLLPAIDCFDGEFLSADHHRLKPDVEIYDFFARWYGLDGASCFFVDDRPANIRGAKDAGWEGFVFAGDPAPLRAALLEWGVAL